jgi:cellulose synthase (UDP-forming)
MKQLRATVRIAMVTPVMIKLPDGRLVAGETIDMSSGGSSIRFNEALDVAPETEVRLVFPLPNGAHEMRAGVVSGDGSVLRVRFQNLSIHEQEVLTMVLYSRADSWLGWGESRENDNVLRSLQRIFQISMHGLVMTFKSLFVAQKKKAKAPRTLPATTSGILLALGFMLAGAAARARAGGHQRRWTAIRVAGGQGSARASSAGTVSRYIQPGGCGFVADRSAWHRQQPPGVFHAAADARSAQRQDSCLVCVLAQPDPADEHDQADAERNALRDRAAQPEWIGRIDDPDR